MQDNRIKSLEPLRALRENATAYFDRLLAKHKQKMACSAGCSKCCEVESLTVHESEATAILQWFEGLTEDERRLLQSIWEAEQRNKPQDCYFLVNRRCSIYDARPIICRTQGAPLRFKVSEDEIGVDACPLNFTEVEQFPVESEWLDLDRLNTLLTIAEQAFQKEIQSRPLKHLLNDENRVSLTSLREFLLTLKILK